MLFNSIPFLFFFLPITLGLFLWARTRGMRYGAPLLLAASVFFYSWWEIKFLPVLLISIALNFCFGWLILHSEARRKTWLIAGLAVNLVGLAFFKYSNFIIDNVAFLTGYTLAHVNITLPIGISFFTFTQIAFLVDAYRREASEPNIVNYGLFVTYFPHLIAGPILHHKEMMPQFSDERRRSIARCLAVGLTILVIGLFKKVAIADPISAYSTPVFAAFDKGEGLSGLSAWIGAMAFTFQLYFDFSAYCDMAIGISYMFGIRLPINFYSPYKATSIIEFWRRWHMTLSRFLRDYLYIPLGGNRKGPVRRHLNLFLTMLLGGMWHGASWSFLIWGALHGLYLTCNHIYRSLRSGSSGRLETGFSWFITFLAVVVAWVFFRAETASGALHMLQAMFMPAKGWLATGMSKNDLTNALVSIALLLGFVTLLPNVYQLMADEEPALLPKGLEPDLNIREKWLRWLPTRARGFAFGATMVALVVMLSRMAVYSEFLYFQF